MIIEQTIDFLKGKYKEQIHDLKIIEVRIGAFLSAVRLSNGAIGIASTVIPSGSEVHCKKEDRYFGKFSPAQFTGHKVMEFMENPPTNNLSYTLRVAILNAISSKILENSDHTILENTDPLDLLDFEAVKTITIVGAFPSYIQKISRHDVKLFVLEFLKEILAEEDRKYFVPASEFRNILPSSDAVIITGSSLVNNTIDELLNHVRKGTELVVTGPSSSLIPDFLFSRGVTKIGSVRITDPDTALKVVSEGGTGYHLFRYCAEKICVVPN